MRSLPPRPNLRFLQEEAKDLLKAHRRGDASTCAIFRHIPRLRDAVDTELLAVKLSLADAQFALAIDYGYATWGDLKRHLDSLRQRTIAADDSGTTFDGRVVDKETDAPLAGVPVQVAPRWEPATHTDSDGRFRLEGLRPSSPDGRIWVQVLQEGYVGAQVMLTRPAARVHDRTFRLDREAVITGTVRDETGALMAGVTASADVVKVESPSIGLPGTSAVTDAKGRYVVRHLPRGVSASVGFSKEGYLYRSEDTVTATDGTAVICDTALEPGPVISGVAVDEGGRPLEGVVVYGLYREILSTTDAQGRFTLGGMSHGLDHPHVLSAIKDGYAITIDLVGKGYGADPCGVVIRMQPERRIHGVVVDESGAPVAGADVRPEPRHPNGECEPATTGADGTFTLQKLTSGPQRIGVHTPGYPRQVFAIEARAMNARLTLRKGASFAGRVVDAETGAPIGAFSVKGEYTRTHRPQPGDGVEHWEPQEFRSPDGVFDFKTPVGLDQVQRFVAFADGYCPAETDGTRPGQPMEIRLPRSSPVTVRVVDAETGDGIDDATVCFSYYISCFPSKVCDPYYFPAEFLPPVNGRPLGGGRYEFTGVGNGPWALTVRREGYVRYTRMLRDGPSDAEVEAACVRTRGKMIRGVVLDQDGRPVEGATLQLDIWGGIQRRDHLTDAQGRFAFDAPAARCKAEISAVTKGLAVGCRTIDLASPAALDRLIFTLKPERTINGVIVDEMGKPVPNAGIGVTLFAGDLRLTTSDVDGVFTVHGLEDGPHRLVMWHVEFCVQRSPVIMAGARDIRLVLKKGRSIVGRVLDAESRRPVSNFSIRLAASRTGEAAVEISGAEKDFCDADGSFDLADDHLSPDDTWRLIVAAAGYETTEVDGVRPGVPAVVKLSKPAPFRVTVTDAETEEPLERAQVAFHYWVGVAPLNDSRDPLVDSDFLAPVTAKPVGPGVYEALGVGRGQWLIRTSAVGYATHTTAIVSDMRGRALAVRLRMTSSVHNRR